MKLELYKTLKKNLHYLHKIIKIAEYILNKKNVLILLFLQTKLK